jgi:hypothetical protein
VRKTLGRFRQRFRQHVEQCLTPTLAMPDETEGKIRTLLAALGGGRQ